MPWLWPLLAVVAAAAALGARVVMLKRRQKLPGFSKDRKGRCHYRVCGIERSSGAKCILHVDAKSPWKAEQMVAEKGISVDSVEEVARLREDRGRREPAPHDDTSRHL